MRIAAAAAIAGKVRRSAAYRTAGTAMFYVTHGSEVPTELLIEDALRDRKRVAVPVIDAATDGISAAAITSLIDDLERGRFGVREPKADRCPPVPPAEIDVVFVPGIAFDRRGHRLGYGKGCYDRWLDRFPVKKRIGLAFDFQVTEIIPNGSHDMPVGMIITEKRVIRCSNGCTVPRRAARRRR